jgi:hypothetical protein
MRGVWGRFILVSDYVRMWAGTDMNMHFTFFAKAENDNRRIR